MNLILFGFKRCGKTYFGKQLAAKLHVPFIDSDHLIETLYRKKFHQPLSCRQIHLKGDKMFRSLEKEALTSLNTTTPSIISLGGGALLDASLQTTLAKHGLLVYLDIDKETLKQRILSGVLPSYLDPEAPEASFEEMYAERKLIYEQIPAVRVSLSGKTDEEILQELITLFKRVF